MKIQSLHLENYRCFGELDIHFDPQLTVLVGVNGSGKTAVLDALGIFLKMYAGNFCHYTDKNNISATNLKHGVDSAFLSCTIDIGFSDQEENVFDITTKLSRKLASNSLNIERKEAGLLGLQKKFVANAAPFPTVVYYSSKRILDEGTRTGAVKSDLAYAYTDAFSPKIDFSTSLSWFIEKASQEALEVMRLKNMDYRIPELSAVRMAVSKALGEYDEPFVGETPPLLLIPQKDDPNKVFRIEELSDGYRTMLALVMDLARRMAVANSHIEWPDGQTVLYSHGVVLIDEVELHLHPSWQQRVLPSLMDIFPNVQFIVTTHSPQILTSIGAKHIRILQDGKVHSFSDETEGAEAGRVLEDVLGVKSRPDNEIVKKLGQYTKLVYTEKWDTQEALELKAELEEHYGRSEPRLKELELHIENSKWERGL